ncbi:hypothetical protein [Flavobacterium sp. 245]|uniref:hypothetical protein n=1 Tax=Flavobacterium sp. 245 TaxID=2512115 RepID=UPI00105E51C5|nr:hypothetical protein [Flavobacterium sp. 245]
MNFAYKKREIPYPIVISKADLIVDGTISKVSKDKYEFVINQFIKGKSQQKINVAIWEEWLCDPRNKELKVGQRLMLFLEKMPNGNFNAINESTGELYIDNNRFVNIFLPKDFSNPTVLKKGISMFLETYSCYGDLNDRFLQNVYFWSNKSIFEIYRLKNDNSVFSYLADYVMSSCKFDETPTNFTIEQLKNYSTNSKTANSWG